MEWHRKTRNRRIDSPFSPARLGENLLRFRVSFSRFHKPWKIASVFLCFPRLFSAFIPPTRENLCPEALLAAVSAAATYGIELDAPCPVAEECPLLPCVLFHFFLLHFSVESRILYPHPSHLSRGCLGWMGMDVFHIRE